MNTVIFDEDELDLEELETIGLARNGHLRLEETDREALLSGRRTGMMRLENLTAEGIHIAALDAKLSLQADASGKPVLMLHPIYRSPQRAEGLTDTEAEELENGTVPNIVKERPGAFGQRSFVLVEFDKETNEYLVTDTEKVTAPDFVNGEELSLDKKERYRKGKEVELEDGTKFQYSGTEREGIRSNRIALIASILIDGGLSFMLYQGLNAMFNRKHDEKANKLSDGYRKAFSDMKMAEGDPEEWLKVKGQQRDNEYSRGYSRGGASR